MCSYLSEPCIQNLLVFEEVPCNKLDIFDFFSLLCSRLISCHVGKWLNFWKYAFYYEDNLFKCILGQASWSWWLLINCLKHIGNYVYVLKIKREIFPCRFDSCWLCAWNTFGEYWSGIVCLCGGFRGKFGAADSVGASSCLDTPVSVCILCPHHLCHHHRHHH